MCLAGRHQGNGKAKNTGKQLGRAVPKGFTLKKGNNWVEALPPFVQVLQVICLMRVSLVHTTVLNNPLLQSLRRFLKTPCTTSNGVTSFLPLEVEL